MLTEFKLPGLGENIKSGVVTKIMVKVGDTIKEDQPIVELETDKAVLEVPSNVNGVVKEILVQTNKEVKIGQAILIVETDAAPVSVAEAPKSVQLSVKTEPPKQATEPLKPTVAIMERTPAPMPSLDVPAAPSVRRFAREIGIDIAAVPGSGPSGRISIEDVKAFAKRINTEKFVGATRESPLPDFSRFGNVERQAMSPIRKKTAEHLSHAWTAVAHVTQFDKADITDLEKLRKKFSANVEKSGGKLTITPFILKILASALKNFPQFSASLDMAKNEIIYKKYYHIGVAVDTDRGLLVPVVRDVDKKTILELAVELNQIAERARSKKTTLEEMQGSSFTITNLGGIGGIGFTPIVNWPDVAILGIARASTESVFTDGHFSPRLMLPLCLSYDHRIIDGADGARFLRWVIEALENPLLMELEK